MQGVIKVYDPGTRLGVVICDTDFSEHELAPDALDGSVFRFLRQGQRVVYDLDDRGLATRVRLGSEVDMGTPGFPAEPATPGFPAEPATPGFPADQAAPGPTGSETTNPTPLDNT